MTLEYKYVEYHPGNGNGAKQAEAITKELNVWAARGWRILKVLRPSLIGPVNLVLERDA
jgi:hypothetical protein